MKFHSIDAVQQILTEFSFCHQLMQVGIGGTNQPYIDVYRIDCPQSGDALLFDGRQQLGLHGQGQVADFIQKQRTP